MSCVIAVDSVLHTQHPHRYTNCT
ncbi:uncharacterized protein METZ01_LOCUS454260, partial [marine metagenome]